MAEVAESILNSILTRLETIVRAETILGKPIEVEGVTLIPVSKISIGFGAGGSNSASGEKNAASGGGGGGGASIQPVAFIVVEDGKTKLVSVKPGKIGGIVEQIPTIIEKISNIKKNKKEDKPE